MVLGQISIAMKPVTQGPGGIEIHGLDLGETEIYSGESLALELGVIVPPWDGGQSIDFSFELETQVTMARIMTMIMTMIMIMTITMTISMNMAITIIIIIIC